MKTSFLIPAALIAVVLICGCASTQTPAGGQPSASVSAQNTSQAPNSGIKFQDAQYYNYAYLISGDTLSADAQRALDGFQMNKKALPDGSTEIDLTAQRSNYQSQSYVIKPGQSLYFIETSWGEDGPSYDGNLGDDGAVIVDSNGYLVQ